ncbi:MAG: Gfo/Idh/MocA family oxidoreductase [Anaerolineae bacterium]|nr:Gfo/Idh/MocA family oxidoreductase [Anaerolineae bacterium]
MTHLRFAVMGTGFWANFQIPAWFEVGGVELVALYNRTRSKAEGMAERCVGWGAPAAPRVYDDPDELFRRERLDFVDIITEIPAHAPLVHLAANHRVPVICQKPMASDFETACGMVAACSQASVPFFVHENFRWQTPIRALKAVLDSGNIGRPFRARIQFIFYKPFVFENQPMLKTLEKLALADVGSHVFDLARFFFGEPHSLYCQTTRVRPDIAGEDVASAMLRFDEVICTCDMSYSSRTEHEQFPQTLFHIEGTRGTVELGPDFWIRLTTDDGTFARRHPPQRFAWADPDYAVVHSSIVPCNADLLAGLRGEHPAETTGEDNLKTVRLVQRAYESAAENRVVPLDYGDCRSI